jgi:deoxycytidylate deaminase
LDASRIRNLPPRQEKWAARLPFTDTLDTANALDRSSVSCCNSVSVTAMIVADPDSRLIATLYSKSNS